MRVVLEVPGNESPEWEYVAGEIMGGMLGLSWVCGAADRKDVAIRLAGQKGEIRLPVRLLTGSQKDWLGLQNLPAGPLPRWDSRELAEGILLVHPVIPVIYGDARPRVTVHPGRIALPIDIFGAAFFMLSRYEEVVVQERDEHDRFPAWASLAYKEGFLDRPIIDEYVEILWAAMKRLWPGLERRPRQRTLRITCDVDSIHKFDGAVGATVLGLAGDLIKRRNPGLAAHNFRRRWRNRRGDISGDPWLDAIHWMMEVNEMAGNRVSFYFMIAPRHEFDGRYSLQMPVVRRLLHYIHARGHEIGLHTGYTTYLDSEQTKKEADLLRSALDEESIPYGELGGRQHYLRWRTPETARNWEAAGMSYDATLSYADHAGFRCGTSREYRLYDLDERRPLQLKERPLIVMECSVIADRYMGLGLTENAFAVMQTLKERALTVGGEFTLLWHNTELEEAEARRFYRELIQP